MKPTKRHSLTIGFLMIALVSACSAKLEVKRDLNAAKTAEATQAKATAEKKVVEEEAKVALAKADPAAVFDGLLKDMTKDESLLKFVASTGKKLNARCGIHTPVTELTKDSKDQYTVMQEISCIGLALSDAEVKAELEKRTAAAEAAAKTAAVVTGNPMTDLASAVAHSAAVLQAQQVAIAGQTNLYRIEIAGSLDVTAKKYSLDYSKADTKYVAVRYEQWMAVTAQAEKKTEVKKTEEKKVDIKTVQTGAEDEIE